MACWKQTLNIMLRVLINDLDTSNFTYSDERINQLLCVAAQYVQQDIAFDNTYTINIAVPSISLDPVDEGDTVFSNFVVLKAACILDQNLIRTRAGLAGIKARCGPADLQVADNIDAFIKVLETGPCQTYSDMRMNYMCGNVNIIRAVLTPFNSNDLDTIFLSSGARGDRGDIY